MVNFGTSSITSFKRLTQSFKNNRDYTGMTCKLYNIMLNLCKYYNNNEVDIELLDRVRLISDSIKAPIDFEDELSNLCYLCEELEHHYNVTASVMEEKFYSYIKLTHNFLLWYKDSIPIETLVSLLNDFVGKQSAKGEYADTPSTRDYLWWRLGFDNIVRIYVEDTKR